MKYSVSSDIKTICAIKKRSVSSLSTDLGVARSTVIRLVNKETSPSDLFLESFYSYAYQSTEFGNRLNDFKIRYALEKHNNVYFHGARKEIDGKVDLLHSRDDVDMGPGFYLGESYEQASAYIFGNKKSSVYLFSLTDLKELTIKEFDISQEWMLAVCYYRGRLEEYQNHPIIKSIIKSIEDADIVIAPIADNNMYEIMNQFARGDITDKQATMALCASHLGKQHVIKSNKACQRLLMIDRLYLCTKERDDIEEVRRENAFNSTNEAQKIIQKHRRDGLYIEELLK